MNEWIDEWKEISFSSHSYVKNAFPIVASGCDHKQLNKVWMQYTRDNLEVQKN